MSASTRRLRLLLEREVDSGEAGGTQQPAELRVACSSSVATMAENLRGDWTLMRRGGQPRGHSEDVIAQWDPSFLGDDRHLGVGGHGRPQEGGSHAGAAPSPLKETTSGAARASVSDHIADLARRTSALEDALRVECKRRQDLDNSMVGCWDYFTAWAHEGFYEVRLSDMDRRFEALLAPIDDVVGTVQVMDACLQEAVGGGYEEDEDAGGDDADATEPLVLEVDTHRGDGEQGRPNSYYMEIVEGKLRLVVRLVEQPRAVNKSVEDRQKQSSSCSS